MEGQWYNAILQRLSTILSRRSILKIQLASTARGLAGLIGAGADVLSPTQSRAQGDLSVFLVLALLLEEKQSLSIGRAVTGDLPNRGILHFQRFQEEGSRVNHTIEHHSDDTIYIAYTPSVGPIWYDP